MGSVDGTDGNDTLKGTSGSDAIRGRGGNDQIDVAEGEDYVHAGDGDDSVSAGSGNNTVEGDKGNDTITAADGADQLYGGDGNDSILSGTGNNTVEGGDGDDVLIGGSGEEQLYGGKGNDTISGAGGRDTIEGGEGDDTLIVADGFRDSTLKGGEGSSSGNEADVLDLSKLTGTITITFTGPESGTVSDGQKSFTFEEIERITVGSGEVKIVNPSKFTGTVTSASSTVDGTDDADKITDGYKDAQGDTIDGPDGEADKVLAGGGSDYVDAAKGNDSVFGGTGSDTLHGGAGEDSLEGGEGDDSLGGWSNNDGNDTMLGGAGHDTVIGGGGNDQVYGGDGNDYLSGAGGSDTIYGGAGNDFAGITDDHGADAYDLGETPGDSDTVWFSNWAGQSGVSVVFGANDSGSYSYAGGATQGTFTGAEVVGGTGYSDRIDAGADTDGQIIAGNEGDDTITGGSGNDRLYAGSGNDSVLGGAGNDDIQGEAGNDRLTGGEGRDTLTGGAGNDTLTTGAGADLVVLDTSGGADRVADFDMTRVDGKTLDQLDVSDLRNAKGGPLTWRDVHVTDTNGDGTGDAVLTFPNGESVILDGVSPGAASGKQNMVAMGIPCLVTGTPILTPDGWRAVEDLQVGDLVTTLQGPRPIIWAGQRRLSAADLARRPDWKPVHFPAGAIGNSRSLRLSPQHAVLMAGDKDALVLVRAMHLAKAGAGRVRIALGTKTVCYHHLLLDRHSVLCAAGAAVESFYPGRQAMLLLDWPARIAIAAAVLSLHPTGQSISEDDLCALYGKRAFAVADRKTRSSARPLSFSAALAWARDRAREEECGVPTALGGGSAPAALRKAAGVGCTVATQGTPDTRHARLV